MSADGLAQVESIAEGVASESDLTIQAVYTSKGRAALQTAEAVAKATGSKVVHWKQLSNLNQGLWQGQTIDAIKSQFPKVYRRWQEHPETVCPPEGEMVSAARERLAEVLAKIQKRTRDGVIAVVVAEPMARILRALLKQEELKDLWNASANGEDWELIEVPAGLPANA